MVALWAWLGFGLSLCWGFGPAAAAAVGAAYKCKSFEVKTLENKTAHTRTHF